MRKLTAITTILFGLWGGYWFVGATALETGLKDHLSANHRANDPIHIAYSDLNVRGFPNRFDTRLADISVTDAARNIQLAGPRFSKSMRSAINPITSSPRCRTAKPCNCRIKKFRLIAPKSKAALCSLPDHCWKKHLRLTAAASSPVRWIFPPARGGKPRSKPPALPPVQTPADALHYDVSISANSITLPASMRAVIDPNQQHPTALNTLSIDSTLGFSHAWNILAKGTDTPMLNTITINNLLLLWGEMQIRANGSLQLDQNGYPVGRLDLTVTNWQDIYDLAQTANAVDLDFAHMIQNSLKVLAGLSEGKNVIKAPLGFCQWPNAAGPSADWTSAAPSLTAIRSTAVSSGVKMEMILMVFIRIRPKHRAKRPTGGFVHPF